MEKLTGIIFPPCGVKLGENDLDCKIICPAMLWKPTTSKLMELSEIMKEVCIGFLEDESCTEGFNSESLKNK
jgi:hypothetical protein